MAQIQIKITELPSIGANVAGNTLLPVVNTAGTAITEKATTANVGNFILTNAGTTLTPAFLANLAYSVTNAAQPNITSVGTLNVNALKISGGTNGYILQTDGTGNVAWVAGGGSGNGEVGGANTQIQFNDNGNFGGEAAFTYDKDTNRMTVGNVTITSNVSADYMTLTHDVHANVVYGNYLYGDGSNITNISVGAGSYIQNGNSNVKVAANSSVSVSVAGNANIFTVTGTGANVTGTFSVSGNINAGNLIATHLSGEGGNISNVGNANYANTANVANSANISNLATYAGTANSVAVANVVGLGNIAVVSLDGSSSNILFGNGVFASAPTGYSNTDLTNYLANNSIDVGGNINPTTDGAYFLGNGTHRWNSMSLSGTLAVDNSVYFSNQGTIQAVANLSLFSDWGNNNYAWTFNNKGSIDIPQNAHSFSDGRIQSANGYPTLLSYGSGFHGGPEIDWMNGDDPQDMSNANVLRHTMYLNGEGLVVGINENGTVGSFSGSWILDTEGNTKVPGSIVFPAHSDIMENGGSLQLESPSNVIIRTNKNAFGQDFVFADDGTLHVPGNIDAAEGSDLRVQVFNPNVSGGVTFSIQNYQVDISSRTTQLEVQPSNIVLSTDFNNNRYQWSFNNTGGITFPDSTVQHTAYTGVAEPGFVLQAGNFNAVAGGRYGVDTWSADGPVTATLPATPNTGDAVFFADASGYAQNGALTIDAGTNSIMGNGTTMTVTTSNQSVGLFWNGRTWRTYNAG